MKTAPDPKDVQEFQFKQSSISQILDGFTSVPPACSLLVADKKRGLVYAGHNSKLTVLKPGDDADPEWKLDFDLPVIASKIALSCECSYLAIAAHRPSVLIYDAQSLVKNSLQLLHEIRITSNSADAFVYDLRWNPCVPGMLCTVASDYTVGIFQMKEEKTFSLKALERIGGLEILCAAWSPKGKQIVVGCRNGSIVQLKPDLKVARTIPGPNPPIGEVITILWISNYQFCAAYLGGEQRLNVLIVDAPKGETTAIFTCYEDITYGMADAEGEGCIPRYYFDHVPEWGLIIAASSGSSEIAVLGSTDNGANWNQWQLVDSGRAQLPLICTAESYPVGMAIDRSPVRKLPWGADATLPNPVPLLHILGTSGQLCSFHMVNLTPNCPAINSPPTELIATPPPQPQPRQSIAPSETSMMMNAVTSTPRPKQPESVVERPKAAPVANIFGEPLKIPTFFKQTEVEKPKLQEQKPIVPVSVEVKQEPVREAPPPQEVAKPENKLATVKEAVPQEQVEQKSAIDDSICIRMYLEEQKLFEKELRSRLEPQTWECGTEEERKALAEGAAVIDQFLRNLRETTNELSSEIAYLKALLLQSFAWVEETKSKNAATSDIITRSCSDNSKLSELRRLYYYTQTQLTQGTKILDLEWSDHKSQEQSKMKIPSLEFVYQNLMLHNKIISKEKTKVDLLKKRWNKVVRSNSVSGLNRSMSNLSIVSPKSTSSLRGNIGVIEARCKNIALKTLSFTRAKQVTLKEILSESAPKVIKPVNPSPIQDRLEATLSSLAALDSVNAEVRIKMEQTTPKQNAVVKQTPEKAKQQSPLASLNSIVARIGSAETNGTLPQTKPQNKLLPVSISFPSLTANKLPQAEKKINTPTALATTLPQAKPKQEVGSVFGQMNATPNALTNLSKAFPKVDSNTFWTGTQKPQDAFAQKPKEAVTKNNKELIPNNEPPKVESNLFSGGALKDALSSESASTKTQVGIRTASLTPAATVTTAAPAVAKTDPMPSFSFASPVAAATTVKAPSQDALLPPQATSAQTFSFASKPASTVPSTFKTLPPTTQPIAQGSLDLTGLSQDLQTTAAPASNNFNVDEFFHYEVSISLVNVTVQKNPDTATSSVTIEEVPAADSKVPNFSGSTVQALPAATTSSIFGSQVTTLSTSIFGGAFTSAPTTTTFSAPMTVPSTSPMPAFGGFHNAASSTANVSTTTTTSSAVSPFYSSLPKPTFGDAITSLPAPSFTSAASAPTSTITFGTPTTATTATTAAPITPVFGKAAAAPLATNNQFPSTQPTSPAANAFGGKPIISPPSMPFGGSPNTSVFGNAAPTSTNTSIFAGTNTNSIFGGSTPAPTNRSMFGGSSTFGTPTSGSIFENNAQKPGLVFGGAPAAGNTSFFGGAASTASPPAGPPSVFGAPPGASPVAGQPVLGAQPAFGQAPTFGSKPVFGSPPNMFGGSKPVFGLEFGSPTFGAGAAPPAFASPPAMGGAPAMENNMPKVFGGTAGSSTFESLASQAGGLSFGSLAQKSPEPEKPPIFTGGSTFSSWR